MVHNYSHEEMPHGSYDKAMRKKIRTVIYLEKMDAEALNKLSKQTGAPVTELARRAIAAYIKKQK